MSYENPFSGVERHTSNEVAEKIPRHKDFTDSVFGKLRSFTVEEQVEILHKLYTRLEEFYQLEMQTHIKHAEELMQRLEVLKKLEPKNNW